jgi:5-methylcytosine-specific restriction endonuclease McrA
VLKKASETVPVLDIDGNPIRYKSGLRAGSIRHVKLYQCASCKQKFKQKDVQVDHVVPAGSLKSFKDLPTFVENLFCSEDGLQVLCMDCHKAKTDKERE